MAWSIQVRAATRGAGQGQKLWPAWAVGECAMLAMQAGPLSSPTALAASPALPLTELTVALDSQDKSRIVGGSPPSIRRDPEVMLPLGRVELTLASLAFTVAPAGNLKVISPMSPWRERRASRSAGPSGTSTTVDALHAVIKAKMVKARQCRGKRAIVDPWALPNRSSMPWACHAVGCDSLCSATAASAPDPFGRP